MVVFQNLNLKGTFNHCFSLRDKYAICLLLHTISTTTFECYTICFTCTTCGRVYSGTYVRTRTGMIVKDADVSWQKNTKRKTEMLIDK